MSSQRTSVLQPSFLPTRFVPRRLALALAACSFAALAQAAATLPTGMQVAQGQANAVVNGNKLTITNSNGAILNWQSFSIGAQNAVRFDQPTAASKVLNRVTGSDPSSILGSLSSNGQVWLLNPNGVLFGQGARVDVAGLVTSTLNLNDSDWSAGRYVFAAPVSAGNGVVAGIANQGEIRSAAGGQVMMISAGEVRNEGLIEAAGGHIVLAAGASVELVDTASPRFSVKVSAPQGEVLNLGQVSAAGGRIDVIAASVNQQGVVRADALSVGPGGEIVMNAGRRLTLAAGSKTTADGAGSGGSGGSIGLLGTQVALMDGSQVSASGAAGGGTVLVGGGAQGKDASVPNADAVYFAPGASIHADATGSGDGGHIVLWSNSATRAYGSLSATGGAQGGDGGFIETSGGWLDARPAAMNLAAPRGKAGTWLLDPYDITISDNVSDSGTDPSFTATTEGSTIYSGTLATALSSGSAVVVQTGGGGSAGNNAGNITVTNANINISSTTPGSLTLIADSDISVRDSKIISQNAMPVSLQAGRGGFSGRISIDDSTIASGGGNITLGGYGQGTTPTYGTFSNAAFASTQGGTGIALSSDSLLDAGLGNLSLAGVGDIGVSLQLSTLRGNEITIRGTGNNGQGVNIGSSALTSASTMTVEGMSFGNGAGVSISAGTLIVAPSDFSSYRTLTVTGTSDSSYSGVEILSANTLLQAGYNTDVYITGTNYNGESDPTLSLKGTIDASQGNGIYLAANSSNTDPTWVSLTNVVMKSASGTNITGAGYLDLNNTQITSGGPVRIEADNVNLNVGSKVVNTSSFDTEAIVITGTNGQPLSTFVNSAGADALQVADTSNGGRWIIWAKDVTDGDSFSPGGLNHDFTLHGAQSSGAWLGYSGNGYVSFQNQDGSAYGGYITKTYDGTTSASPTSITISAPAVGGSASGQLIDSSYVHFGSKNAGYGSISVDAGGVNFVDSAGKPVYGISNINSNLSGQIDPKAVTVSVVVADKTYDTTTTASTQVMFNGLVQGESLQGSAGAANFADAHAGIGKPVSVNMSYSDGADGTGLVSNYAITVAGPVTGNILQAQLNISGLVANSKVYDATTAATFAGTPTVTPLAGDNVSVGGTLSGSFSDKNVGTGKQVTVTGLALTGANAGDYMLVGQPTGLTADITPATLSVTGLAAQNKVYDGTTFASLLNTGVVQALGNDQVSVSGGTGQFSDKNVGNGKTVIVSGVTLSGPDAGNYVVNAGSASLTANITPATLFYVANSVNAAVGADIPALTGGVSGFVSGDTRDNSTAGTLVFTTTATAASPEGRYAVNGDGLTAQNYQFAQAPGNATALTLGISQPQVVVPPVDQSVKSSLDSTATNNGNGALPGLNTAIAAANTGLLDLTSSATSATSATTAAVAAAAAPANAASFAPVRLSDMSMDALAAMLESRDRYKKTLFADAVYKLKENPKLADVHGCTSVTEAAAGNCLVTADFKRNNPQLARVEDAALAQQQPQSAGTPEPASPSSAQRPVFLQTRRHVKLAALPQIERKVAVIIGVDRYDDTSIPQLDNAVKDASAVGKLFETNLGYETVTISNASKATVIATLNRLALTVTPKDSVVIYYAGHGDVVEETGQGYWLLSDADAKKPESWLSNNDIGKLIQQIGASQVALISDSCYSGSLVSADERIRASATPIDPEKLLQRKSVVVMSSGGNEPVFDSGKGGHSPFSYNLMNQLGQLNNWQAGGNVFERVRFAVAKELPQRPQYGASSAAGHEKGGDYLFEQRQLDANTQGSQQQPQQQPQ